MKIFNIRKGFATNSSSSHSILLLPVQPVVKEEEDENFGWDFFTAAQDKSKENYLAYNVYINLLQLQMTKEKATQFVESFFGRSVSLDSIQVDHQSVWTLPRNWENDDLNIEFLEDLQKYLNKKNVVIVGGNDNTSVSHPFIEDNVGQPSSFNKIQREGINNHLVARKDDSHWVLFDRKNGDKIRISFDDIKTPTKALSPELVDIKITDFCPYACTFCYQDSTVQGQHAKMDDIDFIVKQLKDKKVLEVALGGGETTLHPQFVDILKNFKENSIIPNFTTKNLNLFRQESACDILNHCGAIAFSVSSVAEMEKVKLSYIDFERKQEIEVNRYSYSENNTDKPWISKINFQIVMGTMDLKEFKKMLEFASNFGERVTLLGYKDVGRGPDFTPYDYDNYLSIVQKYNYKLNISIDTALAAQSKSQLEEKKVDERTYHITEGTFSAYIDAVSMQLAPSSYGGLEQSVKFDNNWIDSWKNMVYTPSVKKVIRIRK